MQFVKSVFDCMPDFILVLKIGTQRQNRPKFCLGYDFKTNRFITFLFRKKLHVTHVSFSENDVTFMLYKF